MSIGFGVGDIILLTTMIVKTVEDIHDAPAELQDLAERVELVENPLESTHEETSHIVPAPIVKNIVRLKDRIKKVLVAINDIVIKYRDNDGRVNPFHRVKYSLWDKREIASLVLKLEERTNDLTGFLVVQTWKSTKQIRPLIEQVLTQIRQNQEPVKTQSRTESSGPQKEIEIQATSSDQIDQVQAVLDRVLQTERPNDLLPDQEDISVEKEIALQLEQASIGSAFSQAFIQEFNKQRKQLSHAEDFDPFSYSRGKNPLETPKGWIMVIDTYNEGNIETSDLALWISIDIIKVRSIIAQTYLELVRVWTVNNSGEWLFNRVESAGVQVETKFAKRCFKYQSNFLLKGGNPPESAALEAVSGKQSYFQSEEKKDILARVAQHRSRGIDNWHFRKYEYMLCFDRLIYENVRTLAKYCKERYGNSSSYANLSKIILIKDIRLKDSAANLDTDSTTKMVESIKDGITSFLKAEYFWKRPPLSITDGPFRTKQIVLLNVDVKLNPAEEEAKLDEISTKTDCRIRVTDERFDSQLLSVTGRSKALPSALSLLREALLRETQAPETLTH